MANRILDLISNPVDHDSGRDIGLVRGPGDSDQVALREEFSLRTDAGCSKDARVAPIKGGGGHSSGGRVWRDREWGRYFILRV